VTLLERLRVETRAAHDCIEQAIDLEGRLGTLASYRTILERFYGFHVVWEAAVEPLVADRDFFRPRRKTDLLVRDLQALGLCESRIASLPVCSGAMQLASTAAAFGSMYVIEGSTLGGAVISRQIERSLGLGPDAGSAYFRSYGPATGRMWTSFRSRLLSVSSPAADDAIVEAAQRTFAVMQTWLCESSAA
jgi:heme oxygenase (biliverdin-IX-beta and delta-forming)